jgi:hypothetical protein
MSRNLDLVRTVTFSTDTGAYASGDLVADTQEIDAAVVGMGGAVILETITVTDGADQKGILYFVFLNAATSLGTENGAPDITDAEAAANVLGVVSVVAADYVDLGGAAVATKAHIGLMLQAASTTDSLYVGLVGGTTTPTYAADSLTVKFGFVRVEQHYR